MIEYVPLALAVIVLLKVEASLYDGERDNKVYRAKLAEHIDRAACRECMASAEPVCREAQDVREKSATADGSLRTDKP
jgi:hypothetical protein